MIGQLPATEVLARLEGTWHGGGRGSYEGVPEFEYLEETTIVLEPEWSMARLVQRTWQTDAGERKIKPLHLESGLILVRADGALQYGCAQDSGRVEVMTAVPEILDADTIRLAWKTTVHANDPRLLQLGRDWFLTKQSLRYRAYLSTTRTPEYREHLRAALTRTST